MFDYTAVEDRFRTVSWSKYSHPTGKVTFINGADLPTPHNSRAIRRMHIWIFVSILLIETKDQQPTKAESS